MAIKVGRTDPSGFSGSMEELQKQIADAQRSAFQMGTFRSLVSVDASIVVKGGKTPWPTEAQIDVGGAHFIVVDPVPAPSPGTCSLCKQPTPPKPGCGCQLCRG